MRSMGTHKEDQYRMGLHTAVLKGVEVLGVDGSAMDAAIAAVRYMEDCGVFNAGVGSCLTLDGQIEADAAIMNGDDLSYGAVAAVPQLGNAVELANAIRNGSPHCLFAGESALRLGATLPNFEPVYAKPSAARLIAWESQRAAHIGRNLVAEDLSDLGGTHDDGDTVGAVVQDGAGHLAAAVSTGGIWLKQPGRVGDSPIAGAGLWAEDGLVACATTGTGEFIMRVALAADVRARCQNGASAAEAGSQALDALRNRFGPGRAGLIGIDTHGVITTAFHTAGMGRAWMRSQDEAPTVRVWPEEDG
jgi:beta-aspartyl-peptidase (threonine type)